MKMRPIARRVAPKAAWVMNVSADEFPVSQPVVGRGAGFVEHRLKLPQVSESAYITPTVLIVGLPGVSARPPTRMLADEGWVRR